MCLCLFVALYGCYMCLISAKTNGLKALKQLKENTHLFQVFNFADVMYKIDHLFF